MDIGVFFFNDTATTEIYTLSLHDALPISTRSSRAALEMVRTGVWRYSSRSGARSATSAASWPRRPISATRSEEHTSELQSRQYLVCRLLLEKKKKILNTTVSKYFSCYFSL